MEERGEFKQSTFNTVDLPKSESSLWPIKGNPDQYGNLPEQNGRRSAQLAPDVEELAKLMYTNWRERSKEMFPKITEKSWDEATDCVRAIWLEAAHKNLTPLPTMGLYATVEPIEQSGAEAVRIFYQNWKGERAIRNIMPQQMFYGSTPHHLRPQWLLKAFDLDKREERTFALKDILSWG